MLSNTISTVSITILVWSKHGCAEENVVKNEKRSFASDEVTERIWKNSFIETHISRSKYTWLTSNNFYTRVFNRLIKSVTIEKTCFALINNAFHNFNTNNYCLNNLKNFWYSLQHCWSYGTMELINICRIDSICRIKINEH